MSNVCAGLVGGPGLVPGVNYGKDYSVFETVRKRRTHKFNIMAVKVITCPMVTWMFYRPLGTLGKALRTKILQTPLPHCWRAA